MGLVDGLFGLAGDLISTPFDALSDVSKAVQGKTPTALKKRSEEVLKDIDKTLTLDDD